jgi:hypothetical protein
LSEELAIVKQVARRFHGPLHGEDRNDPDDDQPTT